eukprot:GHVS01034861.1.p2 GENE.GHVS01034861.1~~GHVS01034861.1.p2  ORF type:complete len:157 (-),score=11.33 GHVS01034861.1:180-650(-)
MFVTIAIPMGVCTHKWIQHNQSPSTCTYTYRAYTYHRNIYALNPVVLQIQLCIQVAVVCMCTCAQPLTMCTCMCTATQHVYMHVHMCTETQHVYMHVKLHVHVHTMCMQTEQLKDMYAHKTIKHRMCTYSITISVRRTYNIGCVHTTSQHHTDTMT